jgi:D-alanine-D-alanine ligase
MLKIVLFFGGPSVEHEVSVRSAQNIYKALDKKKYKVFLVGLDHNYRFWHYQRERDFLKIKIVKKSLNTPAVVLVNNYLLNLKTFKKNKIDLALPIIHGQIGEDGALAGFLNLANIPFVGPSVLSSVLSIDKDIAKKLLQIAGFQLSPYLSFKKGDKIDLNLITKTLGQHLFVKPANLGSSVGISQVKSSKELKTAIVLAFKFDHKIIIEKFVSGREIECAVLGNGNQLEASVPGEIVSENNFYSYQSKYSKKSQAKLIAPADLSKAQVEKIKKKAILAYKTLEGQGMARVDFFLTKDNQLIINEINTVPGFTQISMFPKLFCLEKYTYASLLDKLIDLAISQYLSNKQLKTSFDKLE